jgi:hypothetical protein
MALYDGPTEGKLRCNPVGCWREVNIAVFPFRTGICARKCPLRRPFFCHTSVRISGSGNLRKCVRDERLYKALYDKGIELTGSYHTFPSVGPTCASREPRVTTASGPASRGTRVGFPGTSEKFRTLDPYRLCE